MSLLMQDLPPIRNLTEADANCPGTGKPENASQSKLEEIKGYLDKIGGQKNLIHQTFDFDEYPEVGSLFHILNTLVKDSKVIQKISPENKSEYSLASKELSWEDSIFHMLARSLRQVRELQLKMNEQAYEMGNHAQRLQREKDRLERLVTDGRNEIAKQDALIKHLYAEIEQKGAKLKMYDNINMTHLTQANNDLLVENESLRASNSALRGVITRMKPKSKRVKKSSK